jgi:hypothetical protein
MKFGIFNVLFAKSDNYFPSANKISQILGKNHAESVF